MQTMNLIDGKWVGALNNSKFSVINPATDEQIATVPDGDASHALRAIEAAAAAFADWSRRSAGERSQLLQKLAKLIERDEDRLAKLMTLEQGKPLAESLGEIKYATSFIAWAAGEAERIYGEIVPASSTDKRILVLKQPVGVTAAITPWNFPAAMITRKLGPALAAGCTMVVRPASQTPLTAIAIGELAIEAGIPNGVVNIVTGDAKQIGSQLFSDQRVRKISFTGSTEVGKVLIQQSAETVTRLSLELGGHAPFIVFASSDINAAVDGTLVAKFRNTGQSCIAANILLVEKDIHQEFTDKLCQRVEQLTVGLGSQDGVDIGPLIDDAAVDKVREHIKDAQDKGAAVRVGGNTINVGSDYTDRFFQPTVLDGVTDNMAVSSEETFGPVLPIRIIDSEAEALQIANDSMYGLAAYFYSQNPAQIMRVAEQLDYGIIGANDGKPSTAQAPFGGVKQSGYGREGGKYVMDDYLNTKYVSWGGH